MVGGTCQGKESFEVLGAGSCLAFLIKDPTAGGLEGGPHKARIFFFFLVGGGMEISIRWCCIWVSLRAQIPVPITKQRPS